MEVWGADIDNAYLEATTKEKLYIVAGPEFEELQGHVLVTHKAQHVWLEKFRFEMVTENPQYHATT